MNPDGDGWILVSDRVPEDRATVEVFFLGLTKKYHVMDDTYDAVRKTFHSFGSGVTHWRPRQLTRSEA